MTDSVFDPAELQTRMDSFQRMLAEQGVQGAVIVQRADLVYYTAAAFQGALVVPAEGRPVVFCWKAKSRIGAECPADVVAVRNMTQIAAGVAERGWGTWSKVGFEEDVVPVAWWRQIGMASWPSATFVDVAPLIRKQRAVKSETELQYVRQAAVILCKGFEAVKLAIREGTSEYVVQLEMDAAMRRAGHQGLLRVRGYNAESTGIVACGVSAHASSVFDGPIGQSGMNPLMPAGAGVDPIAKNKPILVDSAAGFNAYHADMTRTFSIGVVSRELQKAHEFCVELLNETARRLVPGAIPKEIYEYALSKAEKSGYADSFMNRGENKVRFLGHGVGLELDEWPVITKSFTEPLDENTVLAIEPKVVLDEGAVGVEDTIIVKPGGGEIVTNMEQGMIEIS